MKTDMSTAVMAVEGAVSLMCLVAISVMLSCSGTGTEPKSHDRDALVVQATLYAERPVNDVRILHLTKTVHDTLVRFERWNEVIAEYDTIDTVVSIINDSIVDDAQVTISVNGTSYHLDHRNSGWYRETGGDLVITAGRTYRIDVTADGRHAWAETTVPPKIADLEVSTDTIHMVPDDPMEFTEASIEQLSVKWSNPGGGYYYFRFVFDSETPDYGSWDGDYTDKDSIIVRIGIGISQLFAWGEEYRYVTKPARYKVILYATTHEYRSMLADMADSICQDRWVGSPTNINGGLGFFATFSIDSVYFNVAE